MTLSRFRRRPTGAHSFCSLKIAILLSAAGLTTVLPAPVALADPAPAALPPDIQDQLRRLLLHPGLRDGHVGLAVVALGKVASPDVFPSVPYDGHAQPILFARDAGRRFLPASNMKLFTALWALSELGPGATFTTSVYRFVPTERLSRDGVITELAQADIDAARPTAPLFIVGGGDPSLSSADIHDLATQIAATKMTQCGNVYGNGSLYTAENFNGRYPDGWTLDDTIWDYGAPVGALSINENAVQVTWKAGKPGEDATYTVVPAPPFSLSASVKTNQPGIPGDDDLHYEVFTSPEWPSPSIFASGHMAPGQEIDDGLAVLNPENWAASLLRDELHNLKIETGTDERSPSFNLNNLDHSADKAPIAVHVSPPLAVLLNHFLKVSDNLYGEMLLRDAALDVKDPQNLPTPIPVEQDKKHESPVIASTGLAAVAHKAMLQWLIANNVPTGGLRFSDGSGLSRYNMVTPISIARLLGVAETLRGGDAFYQALPIAGVDGTLKSRMFNTVAAGNVHAKTGTFAIVNCMSGYVTTKDGHRLAVSILTNFVPDGELARNFEGRVFATLAGATLVPSAHPSFASKWTPSPAPAKYPPARAYWMKPEAGPVKVEPPVTPAPVAAPAPAATPGPMPQPTLPAATPPVVAPPAAAASTLASPVR